MFCRPPTSPLRSSGTDDTVTAPSCDASAPMPRPASSIGQVTISGPAPMSSSATMTAMPANRARKPTRTTSRGDAFGNSLWHADRGEQQRDRQRQEPHPGGDGGQPERDRQEQRDHEEQAGLQQVLEHERDEPAAQDGVAQAGKVDERFLALRDEVVLPAQEQRAAPPRRRSSARSPATARAIPGRSASAGRTPTNRSARCRTRRDRGPPPTARCRRDRASRRARRVCRRFAAPARG